MKQFFLSAITLLLLSCTSNNKTDLNSTAEVPEENLAKMQEATNAEVNIMRDVSALEFKSLMAEGDYQLIDVRTPEEFESGTIEGAMNIDYKNSNFSQNILKISPSKRALVFCMAGHRGGKAMEIMADLGFTEVYNLEGGFSEWPTK